MFTYRTSGTCSSYVIFDVVDNKLQGVKFISGCNGNLQGIGRLAEGRDIDEVEKLLAGIRCRGNTSCPDQLSKAITAYKKSIEESKN